MPLDVRGRARSTMTVSASQTFWPERVGQTGQSPSDRGLELFPVNEEFLVSASHKLALFTSLPFVHTARRYYRLNGSVRSLDWRHRSCGGCPRGAEKTTKLDHLEE
uniref:Uncharacterized protein n=1 Tax=Hydatigena taeniaeformis TaxID=6205 RepID=A0A0R3XD81_HYDTA